MPTASIIQLQTSRVVAFGEDRHVIKTEFKDRCFIFQSFGQRLNDYGEIEILATVSFLADSGKGNAAEWEPKYGPIQMWTECEANWVGDGDRKPRSHWHFACVQDNPGDWSQLSVERERLKEMLVAGDIDGVFSVLLRWADSRREPNESA